GPVPGRGAVKRLVLVLRVIRVGNRLAVLLRRVLGVVVRVVLAVLLVGQGARLLLGLVLELLAVQVVVVALLQVLVELGGGEAGQEFLAELMVLGDALVLTVVLVHAHGLEARRAGEQLVRDLVARPLVVVNLVIGVLCAEHVEKSHGRQRSPTARRINRHLPDPPSPAKRRWLLGGHAAAAK